MTETSLHDYLMLRVKKAEAANLSPEREADLINRALSMAGSLFVVMGQLDDADDTETLLARRAEIYWLELKHNGEQDVWDQFDGWRQLGRDERDA